MENWCYSGWSQSNASVCNESSDYVLPWPPLPQVSTSTALQFDGFPSLSVPIERTAEDVGATVSNSHSQAEKRRRDRINAQLATLRKLIPKSDKMDKAALLGSVIDQVKDLKRKATEISKGLTVPTDIDEVSIDCDISEDINPTTSNDRIRDRILIKASVCCDDRPELFAELIQVLKGLRLKAVKADIASVGGRIKSILFLCTKDCEDSVCLSSLQQSLKLVLSKIASSSSSMQSNCRIRSKRQRFFLPSNFSG